MAFYHNILRVVSMHENPHLSAAPERAPAGMQRIVWDKATKRYREVTFDELLGGVTDVAPKRQQRAGYVDEARRGRGQAGNRQGGGTF